MMDLSKVSYKDIGALHAMKQYQDAMDTALAQLFAQIRKDAESAIHKRFADELTEGEKFALAYYARVPMQRKTIPLYDTPYEFRMTTVPCGFFHNGEKWIVTMRAEDER